MSIQHISEVEKNLDRCYEHPGLSPWHVREAMRGLLQIVKDQQIDIQRLTTELKNKGKS